MEILTEITFNRFKARVDSIDSEVPEGALMVSEPLVMRTCALYIGTMCAEYLDGEWLYQPYERLTEYLSANEVTGYWREYSGNSNWREG